MASETYPVILLTLLLEAPFPSGTKKFYSGVILVRTKEQFYHKDLPFPHELTGASITPRARLISLRNKLPREFCRKPTDKLQCSTLVP